MKKLSHSFQVNVSWRASAPDNDRKRRTHSRAHTISSPGLETIRGSSAKQFHGDSDRWNPEQLLIASAAQCHMMTFLFLAQKEGIEILAYNDNPVGTLSLDKDGIGGQLDEIVLKPAIYLRKKDRSVELENLVSELHAETPKYCFIARSIHTPIAVNATLEYL